MNFKSQKITVPGILNTKSKQKISALTAYDYTFAKIIDQSGIDLILVGDSLASVVQGHPNTLPVTLDEMIYHCKCVTAGVDRALVVADMPFMSYQVSPKKAVASACKLVKEGKVAAVKLEGGQNIVKAITAITAVDIPVMGHVGLTPQSYHRMGGYKIQGKTQSSREQIIKDALAVEKAGVFAIVLECIPADLAKEITEKLTIPSIGIGSGPHCDGQILVFSDMLGLNTENTPKFVKKYRDLKSEVIQAINEYNQDINL